LTVHFAKSFEVLLLFKGIGEIISYCVDPYKYFSDIFPLVLKTRIGSKIEVFFFYI